MVTVAIALFGIISVGSLLYINFQIMKAVNLTVDKVINHLHTHSRVGDLAINVEHQHKERMKSLEIEEMKATANIAAANKMRERAFVRIQDPQS